MGGSLFVVLVGSSGLDMMCHTAPFCCWIFVFVAPKLPNHLIYQNLAINNQKQYAAHEPECSHVC